MEEGIAQSSIYKELLIPARLEHLSSVQNFITENIPPAFKSIQSSLELVAEELLVNVFSYAYPDPSTGTARVSLCEIYFDNQPMLRFSVEDFGKPFNPYLEVDRPDLEMDIEARPIGGLGIYLIQNMSAHQAYTRLDNRNIIDVYFTRNQE